MNENELRDEVMKRAGDIAKILIRGSDVEIRKTRNGVQVASVAKQVVVSK